MSSLRIHVEVLNTAIRFIQAPCDALDETAEARRFRTEVECCSVLSFTRCDISAMTTTCFPP
jgi:hypothetical protein